MSFFVSLQLREISYKAKKCENRLNTGIFTLFYIPLSSLNFHKARECWKSVCEQSHMGSNPTLCAIKKQNIYLHRQTFCFFYFIQCLFCSIFLHKSHTPDNRKGGEGYKRVNSDSIKHRFEPCFFKVGNACVKSYCRKGGDHQKLACALKYI